MKPKYLNVRDNVAYIRDFNLVELAKAHGTPLMIFDEVELRENMRLFAGRFKDDDIKCHIAYASKALLLPYLCKIVCEEGLLIDAVSLGDLYVIKHSGFNMANVIFHGNNKTKEELEFAIENDCIIVVDNLNELQELVVVAKSLDKKVRTMARVNPGIDAHTHKYIQTALITSKFGESIHDVKKIDGIMAWYEDHPNIKLLGFHSHIGSQIQDEEPLLENVKIMMKFSKHVEETYDYKLSAINFGGGFGVNYVEGEKTLDVASTLDKMIALVKNYGKEINFLPKDVYIEPGRSILGAAGITLYTCGLFKENMNGHHFQFIDGGMTDNIRPALYEARYEADIAEKMNYEKNVVCDLAGKCCESGDIIGYDVNLPTPRIGDILILYTTGAYTYSMSSNYNNMLKLKILFLSDKVNVAAKRQTLDNLMELF